MRSSADSPRCELQAPYGLADMLASPPASQGSNRSAFLLVWSLARPRILRPRGAEKDSSSKCLTSLEVRNCLVHLGPKGRESADARDEQTLCRCAPVVRIFLNRSSFLSCWLEYVFIPKNRIDLQFRDVNNSLLANYGPSEVTRTPSITPYRLETRIVWRSLFLLGLKKSNLPAEAFAKLFSNA